VTELAGTFVIGAGRAGVGTFLAFQEAGIPVRLFARNPAACPLPLPIESLDGPFDRPDLPIVFILAVSDRAITAVLRDLETRSIVRPGDVVGHLSGALPAAILQGDDGTSVHGRFSAHPLHAFAPPQVGLAMPRGTTVMVEGDAPGLEVAQALFAAVGAHVAPIRPEAKPLCHAAAVLASNLPATLLLAATTALADAGVPDPGRTAGRLAASLLRNWASNPHPATLTGPVARGDAATVAANLDALADHPEVVRLYADLTRRLADALRDAHVIEEASWTRIHETLSTANRR
jgi:predicted short-subunit dehydrogenase-like oxidoreductase (DUF2520 family)